MLARVMFRLWTIFVLACVGCAARPHAADAQSPLAVTYRGLTPFASSTVDQNGVPFTITGVSGITRAGGDDYLAVMDNSNKIVRFTILFNPNGSIQSASVTGGVSVALTRDFEGIAVASRGPGGAARSVYLAEEDTPTVHEVLLSTGAVVRTLSPPAIFAQRRGNFGFESLTLAPGSLWAANEEALTPDGPVSTPSAGTVVRLLQWTSPRAAGGGPTRQFAYLTQPMHGSTTTGARSGVSDLVALPDGRLIALERSFAFNLAGFFQARLYELNFNAATEVSGFTAGLSGQTYTPVSKRLLWQGGQPNNLEGICLGPPVSPASRALIGIVDDADPISSNVLAAFELRTQPTPAPDSNTQAPSGRN